MQKETFHNYGSPENLFLSARDFCNLEPSFVAPICWVNFEPAKRSDLTALHVHVHVPYLPSIAAAAKISICYFMKILIACDGIKNRLDAPCKVIHPSYEIHFGTEVVFLHTIVYHGHQLDHNNGAECVFHLWRLVFTILIRRK